MRHKVPDFRTMKGFVEGLAKGGRMAEAKDVVAEVKKKFPENLLSGWKKLEKELGLNSDSGDVTPQAECMSEEPLAEAESATTGALELEESGPEETFVSEESTDNEAAVHEASIGEEVPRGPA